MPSSDPLTPLPEIDDVQSDVEMSEEYQKDLDGCRQDQGAVAEPGVERELKDDAVHKAVEGENPAGDQVGEDANLVVNNGGNAKARVIRFLIRKKIFQIQVKSLQSTFARRLISVLTTKGQHLSQR